ncbi:MAG: FtsQ-type POTRA domain-containing protein [Clostridia bacterium]|nr:FtsQ-type POTRA domain-containing protein [Clostridia bacterium]
MATINSPQKRRIDKRRKKQRDRQRDKILKKRNKRLKKQQKQAYKRKHRKQIARRRRFVIILAVIFVAIIFVLSNTVLFLLDDIEVVGNEIYAADDITALMEVAPGDNLFRIDTDAEAARVAASLPYIDEIKVSRRFPNKLRVTVLEEKIAYKIGIEGASGILLNNEGKVLERVDYLPAYDVTEVVGANVERYELGQPLDEEADEGKIGIVNNIVTYIAENEIPNIKFIDIKDKFDIRLNYNMKIRIYLGEPSELEDKIIMLGGVLERIHDTDSGTIDIRSTTTAFFNPMN